MLKTTASNIARIPSNATKHNKDKEKEKEKDNKTTTTQNTQTTREVLSNITNNNANKDNKDNTTKSKDKESKKMTKSSKKLSGYGRRPSGVLDASAVVDGTKTKGSGNETTSCDGNSNKIKVDSMLVEEHSDSVQAWEDIDINDVDDPQAVTEYVNDIYQFLMEKEKDSVDPDYMSTQTDINEKMRAILVDWLIEVHRMFKLLPESLFLSISIIDRYLSVTPITREKLQLVGVTAMLIASKYEEIYSPECNDFVYISDGAYTKQNILKMEQNILNTLQFNLTHPSHLHFLRRYSKAAGSDYTLHTLCKYLIELMLIDVKFLRFAPSLVAAASVYLARAMTSKSPLWGPTLEHYSSYSEERVRECAKEMNVLLKKSQTSSLKAIKKKYSLPKFGQVAEIPVVDL